MSKLEHFGERGWLWETFQPGGWGAAAELAELRRALFAEPGDVPYLWRLHRMDNLASVRNVGWGIPSLRAEHYTMALFGHHQSGSSQHMHTPGVSVGTALRRIRPTLGDKCDQMMVALSTAYSVTNLVNGLHPLVRILCQQQTGLDYTDLLNCLYYWHWPHGRMIALRQWSFHYHIPTTKPSSIGHAHTVAEPLETTP